MRETETVSRIRGVVAQYERAFAADDHTRGLSEDDPAAKVEARWNSLDRNSDGLTFIEWMVKVDSMVVDIMGIGVADCVDFTSYDTWKDGASPDDALDALAEMDDLFSEALEMYRSEESRYGDESDGD